MFKVNNKNTRPTSNIFTSFPSVSIIKFEQVNVSWVISVTFCLQSSDRKKIIQISFHMSLRCLKISYKELIKSKYFLRGTTKKLKKNLSLILF